MASKRSVNANKTPHCMTEKRAIAETNNAAAEGGLSKRRRYYADNTDERRARGIFDALVAWYAEHAQPAQSFYTAAPPSVHVDALDTMSRASKQLRDKHRALVPSLEATVTRSNVFDVMPCYSCDDKVLAERWTQRDTRRVDNVKRMYLANGDYTEQVKSYEAGRFVGSRSAYVDAGGKKTQIETNVRSTPAGRRARHRHAVLLGDEES